MKRTAISDIIVPDDRWRKEFDEEEIRKLSENIEALGLFHAPIVKDDGVTLIAGERRLRAIRLLAEREAPFSYGQEVFEPGTMPVVPQSEMDDDAALEIELEENVAREDLNWKDKSRAIAYLHKTRTRQAEEEGRTHTIEDTKREIETKTKKKLGRNTDRPQSIKQNLIIEQWLDDPEVAAAPNAKEALKIIERKVQALHRKSLAKQFDLSKLNDHTLLNASLFDEIPKLPDHSFDLIIFDPPFGIDANDFVGMSGSKHTYEDSAESSDSLIEFVCKEGLRFCRPNAHLYMFCDIERFFPLRDLLTSIGWTVFRTPFIWDRYPSGIIPIPEYGPRRCYEAILYARIGDKRVNETRSDVLRYPQDKDIHRGAKKPAALYRDLIERSCVVGDRIIDPCCGIGPIFPAANDTKTVATGFEIDDAAYDIAIERIAKTLKEDEG